MQIKSRLFQAQADECRIKRDDLSRLDQVKEVLTLLNDPYIGPYKLADCIEGLPVLAARCRREAALHRPRNEVENIERALNVLGNRGIEKVLLELLEDMTIFKSEIEVSLSTGPLPIDTSIKGAAAVAPKVSGAPAAKALAKPKPQAKK